MRIPNAGFLPRRPDPGAGPGRWPQQQPSPEPAQEQPSVPQAPLSQRAAQRAEQLKMQVKAQVAAMRRRPPLVVAGVVALVAVLGVAVIVRTTGACAVTYSSLVSAVAADRTGRATFYGNAAPGGNCSFPTPPADHLTAALGPADYAKAAACGGYLEVSGRRGTIVVKVDNQCPECEPGHLDLSTEAFAKLDALSTGTTPITFHQVVNPSLSSGLSFRVKEGSSQFWFALLVDQHGNPLRSVEVSSGGGAFTKLIRADYNYWLAERGAGTGPFTVRVTDVLGHSAVVSGITLRPGAVQTTGVRLYAPGTQSVGAGTAGSPSTKAGSAGTASRSSSSSARQATASKSSSAVTPGITPAATAAGSEPASGADTTGADAAAGDSAAGTAAAGAGAGSSADPAAAIGTSPVSDQQAARCQ